MSPSSKTRQANFELMRIFAMFLIVVWHIKGHYMEGSDVFHPLVMKAMSFISQIISFHVDSFILITGYFGIKNNKKGIVKNFLLCAIYLWGFNIFSYMNNGQYSILEILFPITHSPWWFMTVYFMLVLVSPFMERLFLTFDKGKWYSWIATLLILDVYFGHYHHVGSVYLMGFDLMNMVTLYSIGAMLRHPSLYERFIFGGGEKVLLLSLLILVVLKVIISKVFFLLNLSILPGEYCAPLVIALAVNVFLLFKRITIKQNKFITFFASSAVSVYLITEYPLVREWLTHIYRQFYPEYCHNTMQGFVFILISSFLIFVICVLIDKLRICIQRRMENIILKRLNI